MAQIELGISGPAIFALFDADHILPGMRRSVPGGVITLEAAPQEHRVYTASWPVLVELSGAAREFAAWLYGKLSDRSIRQIRVNRKLVEVTPAALTQAILEAMNAEG